MDKWKLSWTFVITLFAVAFSCHAEDYDGSDCNLREYAQDENYDKKELIPPFLLAGNICITLLNDEHKPADNVKIKYYYWRDYASLHWRYLKVIDKYQSGEQKIPFAGHYLEELSKVITISYKPRKSHSIYGVPLRVFRVFKDEYVLGDTHILFRYSQSELKELENFLNSDRRNLSAKAKEDVHYILYGKDSPYDGMENIDW
ncbi:hypothetical protein [Thalassotalea litorea]|uniref:hypothetical protein n=1 Tax=Thalassotalea litorea TaxID=2020715 RepID=UPI003736AC2C